MSKDGDDGGEEEEEGEAGGCIVKSCPASFAGQLHCCNTFAGQVSPNPERMTSASSTSV